jgi:hypothetical protein
MANTPQEFQQSHRRFQPARPAVHMSRNGADLPDDEKGGMLRQLIKQPRAVIDAVAATQPRTWSETCAIVAAAKKTARP